MVFLNMLVNSSFRRKKYFGAIEMGYYREKTRGHFLTKSRDKYLLQRFLSLPHGVP